MKSKYHNNLIHTIHPFNIYDKVLSFSYFILSYWLSHVAQ